MMVATTTMNYSIRNSKGSVFLCVFLEHLYTPIPDLNHLSSDFFLLANELVMVFGCCELDCLLIVRSTVNHMDMMIRNIIETSFSLSIYLA